MPLLPPLDATDFGERLERLSRRALAAQGVCLVVSLLFALWLILGH
jgi:hypothetical protein